MVINCSRQSEWTVAIYEQREMDMLFRHKTQIYLNIFFSIQLFY